MRFSLQAHAAPTVWHKIGHVRWSLVALLCLLAAIGSVMLYSAADGALAPWAGRHALRFAVALGLMLVVALTDIRFWLRNAYALYVGVLLLLAVVEVSGTIGMGAQRWVDLGVINVQPSELMKLALVLALARYYHGLNPEQVRRPVMVLLPLVMVGVPTLLILKQPDLGTAVMLLAGGGAVIFAAGLSLWIVGLGIAAVVGVLPVAWQFLHEYQRARLLTFLDPDRDPLGAGYHITQSKIALGSGGLFGKGYLHGTQSHLNFLPEKHTDFIFTMFAEEFGLVGTLTLLAVFAAVVGSCVAIALRARNQFSRLLAIGVTTTFFLYVFINLAMVMGLIPVVGVPLPLVSYGGTAMLGVMLGFGLVLSVHVHRDAQIGRHSWGD